MWIAREKKDGEVEKAGVKTQAKVKCEGGENAGVNEIVKELNNRVRRDSGGTTDETKKLDGREREKRTQRKKRS